MLIPSIHIKHPNLWSDVDIPYAFRMVSFGCVEYEWGKGFLVYIYIYIYFLIEFYITKKHTGTSILPKQSPFIQRLGF